MIPARFAPRISSCGLPRPASQFQPVSVVGPEGVREVHMSPPTLHAVLAHAVAEGQVIREGDGTAASRCEGEFYRAGTFRLLTKPDRTSNRVAQ